MDDGVLADGLSANIATLLDVQASVMGWAEAADNDEVRRSADELLDIIGDLVEVRDEMRGRSRE